MHSFMDRFPYFGMESFKQVSYVKNLVLFAENQPSARKYFEHYCWKGSVTLSNCGNLDQRLCIFDCRLIKL